MSAHLKLRDYQQAAIDAVFKAWSDGIQRPAIVLPTGAGKTVVFSHLIREFRNSVLFADGRSRVIVLVHRDELADQAIAKIRAVAPDLRVGKVKASDNDIRADVMVCSVQTISRMSRLATLQSAQGGSGAVGLIITDECHHAAAVSYKTVYAAFPDALQLGVTATMARGDGVGLGSTWEEVVYSRSILSMIGSGHLVDVKAQTVTVDGLDLGSVKTSRGDYQAADLGEAMEESGAQHVIAKAYAEHAADRQGIVFTPTVATAEQTADALTLAGITALPVSGDTPRDERREMYERFRRGDCQVLVNCMVLTEGFDAPWASCAVVARPTRSQPLYVQMVGRVLRPWAQGGKKDALVLNLNGAGGKLSTLIDLQPGAVEKILPGETLAEAVEREEAEASSLAKRGVPKFELKSRHVSLFEASKTAWLTTAGGVMFINAGEWCYFLWPSREGEPGTWDVCRKHKAWDRGVAEATDHGGLPVELAMSWAEAEAETNGSFSVHRAASWRKGKPTDKMIGLGYRLGIQAPDQMSKAELSDAIDVAWRSSELDGFIGRA